MRTNRKQNYLPLFTVGFMLLITITLSQLVYGHGEEQLGGKEGEKKATPISNSIGVELSDIAQKSIGLKVVEADIRQVEEVLLINGIVKPEPNRTLFRIADLSKVIVEGDVFESDVSKVKLGQDTRIKLDAYPDKVFTGKVTFVASQLDPMKRTLHLWVSIDNKEGLLKPELFARVALVVKHSKEVLTVPVEAIIDDGAEKFVFVKNGNKFVRQDVATGVSDDRYVEITDGLYPGDQVVTDGNRQIYTKWLFSGGLEERE